MSEFSEQEKALDEYVKQHPFDPKDYPEEFPNGHVVFEHDSSTRKKTKVREGLCRCDHGKPHDADFQCESLWCAHGDDWEWWQEAIASGRLQTATGRVSNVRHVQREDPDEE